MAEDINKELDEISQQVETLTKKPKKNKGKPPNPAGTRFRPIGLMDTNLTVQQEAYARAMSMGMSRQESMQMAGIKSSQTARDFERDPKVSARITELAHLITENSILKNGLDRSWVISRLMSVTERCMQAEPVMDKNGDPTGEYKFDSSGANRALELLGKTMRMFDAKETSKQDDYAHLSDDEISRIASELAAQTGLLAPPEPTYIEYDDKSGQ